MSFFKRMIIVNGLLLCSIASAVNAHASSPKPKVLLLTSVDFHETARQLPWWLSWRRNHYRKMFSKLEREFRKGLEKEGVDIQVSHFADQYSIWNALHSPDYKAIYWLSHGGSSYNPMTQEKSVKIYDYQYFEVNKLFADVHPNIKFIGFINCLGASAVERLRADHGWERTNPDLQTFAFKGKIDARKGLKKALNASRALLRAPSETKPGLCQRQKIEVISLYVTRNCQGSRNGLHQSVRVEGQDGEILAVFDKCQEGQVQRATIALPARRANDSEKIKLTVKVGSRPVGLASLPVSLGYFDISLTSFDGNSDFAVFADNTGRPIGKGRHVYQLNMSHRLQVHTINKHKCHTSQANDA